jgi:S-adenosyl-L-methionine hydrolase (adenosine-forming)
MILLFTDFGLEGPYIGQVKAALWREAPGTPVFDLFSDAPVFSPKSSAYLLAAYTAAFPKDSIFLAVVDPGVGTPWRRPVVVRAGGCWFVGPDNGLFNVVMQRDDDCRMWDITWDPSDLSATFHGRDLFAPVAARLARGEAPPGEAVDPEHRLHKDWPGDLPEIVYVDRYGNAITGLRAATLPKGTAIEINGQHLEKSRTFGDVTVGDATWYENANGLAEIAVNRGSAAKRLGLEVGSTLRVITLR